VLLEQEFKEVRCQFAMHVFFLKDSVFQIFAATFTPPQITWFYNFVIECSLRWLRLRNCAVVMAGYDAVVMAGYDAVVRHGMLG